VRECIAASPAAFAWAGVARSGPGFGPDVLRPPAACAALIYSGRPWRACADPGAALRPWLASDPAANPDAADHRAAVDRHRAAGGAAAGRFHRGTSGAVADRALWQGPAGHQ